MSDQVSNYYSGTNLRLTFLRKKWMEVRAYADALEKEREGEGGDNDYLSEESASAVTELLWIEDEIAKEKEEMK